MLTIIEVSFTIWAAFQISKGADLHKLNLYHLKYAAQYEAAIDELEKGGEVKTKELVRIVNDIKEQSILCLSQTGFLDKKIMQYVGTAHALDLCHEDIGVANGALDSIAKYKKKTLTKTGLIESLNKSHDVFYQHSADFEEPISKTVGFIFRTMIPMVIFLSLFNILFITYLSKTITGSIKSIISVLSDDQINPSKFAKISNSVSGELLELLELSRKRVKKDLLNIETSEELKKVIKEQTENIQMVLTRQELALKASKVGVWDWDLILNVLTWDQQMYSLYGINKDDFEGVYQAWEKGLHPEDKERSAFEIQEAVKNDAKFDTEFRVIWPSGEVRNIRALADLVKDEKGNAIKMIGVNWDITDVKNSEKDLKQVNHKLSVMNEELSQFAYRTSHDLKAPLITSKRLAKYLLKDIEEGSLEEAKKNTAKILNLMNKSIVLVEDILLLVKADVNLQAEESIDLHIIMKELSERLELLAEENSCEIQQEIKVKDNLIIQKARITQILENLISNGIKFRNVNQDRSFVKISIKKDGNDLVVIVQDNGVGIPKDRYSEVYKMFKRFHSKLSFGSGLGMSIVKKHVDRLGGEIAFTSSDEGTQFNLRLPGAFKKESV